MAGLSGLVYAALVMLSSRHRSVRRISALVVSVGLVELWAVAALFLEIGDFDVSIRIRQAGLVTGVAGLVLIYLPLRLKDRSVHFRRMALPGILIYGIGLVFAAANWFVAAAAVVLVSSALRPVGGYPAESVQPPPDPPDVG